MGGASDDSERGRTWREFMIGECGTGLPTGTDAAFLSLYLQSGTTKYFYCYDGNGQITNQHEAATAC